MRMIKLAIFSAMAIVSSSSFAAGWAVSYSNDEMRGTAQKFIQTDSDNKVDFEFPYNGGSTMSIVLRSKKVELKEGQKAEDLQPTEAILLINKGQFICHSFNDCHVSVKFDNDKIQTFAMSGASDANSKVIFFNSAPSFIKQLKSHKKLFIEASFFQAGEKQFKFDIEGLSTSDTK